MSSVERPELADGIPRPDFLGGLLSDYTKNLDRFFDVETGTVKEEARDDGRPPFLFTEVTGYAIRDLLLLHSITGDACYLSKAIKASDWLIHTACDESGWLRTRYYFERDNDDDRGLDSFAGGNIFSFDNGICLGGLVGLYEVLKKRAIREPELAAKVQPLSEKIDKLAGNILARLDPDGSISAICDARGTEVQFEDPRWSQRRGSFHAKIAESLAELYALTLVDRYADAARRICMFVMSHQEADGRFLTDAAGNTQLHPHCYSAEGLLRVGILLKEEQFISSAGRATAWALRQCHDGNIAQEIGRSISGSSHHRTDALAQVLSLGAQMIQSGVLSGEYWGSVSELAYSVLAMKNPDEGYFRYGFYEDGKESNTFSYWTNMFAFHSLLEYCAAWISRNLSVIVLAGGIGSRCWPISCVELPKPLSRGILGERSLLEETVSRFLKSGCAQPQNVFVLSTTNGLERARDQMQSLGIPLANIIDEPKPKGTLGALQYALTQVGSRLREIVVISTADDLIEPLSVFRQALARAALVAWWDKPGIILSLGIPNQKCDPRFGHAIYRKENEIAPDVYYVDRFIEKPSDLGSLQIQEHESYAWDSGCIISQRSYVSETIERLLVSDGGADHTDLEGDITRKILEDDTYRKGVSLYSPTIRFVDVGAPGKDLRDFFFGTKADRGNGNIFLGSDKVEAIFLSARGNIVISDKMSVVVIGINDSLIIDNSHTNSGVVLPLDKVDSLPTMYRMFEGVDGFHPYIVGGEITRHASPHNLAHDCQGQCDTDSSYGLALAIYCKNMRLKRTSERLLVVDQSHARLSDCVVDMLTKKKIESMPDCDLQDVTVIAEMLARPPVHTRNAQEVPHLLCLTHDGGAYLAEDRITKEDKLTANIKNLTELDWTIQDSRVLQKLIYTASD